MVNISINLPQDMVKCIDELMKEVEITRTDVIHDLLAYALDNDVDSVFPPDEDGEDEEAPETEDQLEEDETHDPKKGVNRNRRGGGLY